MPRWLAQVRQENTLRGVSTFKDLVVISECA
jgi:hypothetical protein